MDGNNQGVDCIQAFSETPWSIPLGKQMNVGKVHETKRMLIPAIGS